jgi:DNA polymerase-3 subunit delta'
MRFADIPGHEDIKRHLASLVDDGHMPHALLIEGPEGTAKFMLARALAQYIHCNNRSHGDSCGICPSCRQHQALSHIDTVYSYPVIKKNSKPTLSGDWFPEFKSLLSESPMMDLDIWLKKLGNPNTQPKIYVEEGQELLRRLAYTAHGARYKVVIMWLPERMNEDTANKMLKLIEEPYNDTLFIMTSDNPRGLLPTIYSRVQRVKVKRYDDATLIDYLIANHKADHQTAADTATIAEGNMVRAIKLLQSNDEGRKHFDAFVSLMRLAYQRNIGQLKKWSQEMGSEKREPLMRFLDYCCRMLRENFIYNFHDANLNAMTATEQNFSVNFARFINERNVLKLIDVFTDARNDVSANANPKIVMFDLTISVILLLKN